MSQFGFKRLGASQGALAAFALALLLSACAPGLVSAKAPAATSSAAGAAKVKAGPTEPLTILTTAGRAPLQVEIADTEAERELGLMFRRTMAPDHGMLFDFKTPRSVYFWMKNTYLPLDMIFIAGDGRIVAIAPNTTPMSEAPVGPGVPVLAVLELNAGRAAALGVRPGDQVQHRIFAAH